MPDGMVFIFTPTPQITQLMKCINREVEVIRSQMQFGLRAIQTFHLTRVQTKTDFQVK